MAKSTYYLRNSYPGMEGAAPDFFHEPIHQSGVEVWCDHGEGSMAAVDDLVDRGAIISFTVNRAGLLTFPKGTRLLGSPDYQQKMSESIEDMLFRMENYSGRDLTLRHEDALHQIILGCFPGSKSQVRLSRKPSSPLRRRGSWFGAIMEAGSDLLGIIASIARAF